MDDVIFLGDGRRLGFAEWGTADGPCVLYIHSSSHSRLSCPNVAQTNAAGVRLVTVDRPGYGRSDVNPALTIGAWPQDVIELADALQISRFAVVGASGGGVYAAACAAKIPDRLVGAGAVSGAGWPVYDQPGAYERLDEQERLVCEMAQHDLQGAVELSIQDWRNWADGVREDARGILDESELADGDRWFFDDPDRAALFYRSMREAVAQGPVGLAWGSVVSFAPWGFALEEIPIEFHLWHGAQDMIETADDVDFWAGRIPKCTVTSWPDAGHLGVAKHWDEVLMTLLSTR